MAPQAAPAAKAEKNSGFPSAKVEKKSEIHEFRKVANSAPPYPQKPLPAALTVPLRLRKVSR
jgi:hypothetical protein